MHTKPMEESEGAFTRVESRKWTCRHCLCKNVTCKVWESSCGGYEDYKYTCPDCGYVWWVDGIDS
jgi:hypothetical protein